MRRGAILLSLAAFVCLERFCHDKTKGFRIQKIQSPPMLEKRWETDSLDPMHAEALSQPYRFLGSGGQCYAFVSEDGRYVLKFFKQHHMREAPLVKFLPFTEKWCEERRAKREKVYTSCKIAHDHFREGTGLLHLHLNTTDTLPTPLTLYDPIGAVHKIDLNKLAFALQEKAEPAYETLSRVTLCGDLARAKNLVTSLVNLIAKKHLESITDHDPRKRNFGFVGDRAIEIDLGSFSLSHEKAHKRTFNYETSKLRSWVKKYTPALLETLEKEIARQFPDPLQSYETGGRCEDERR